MNRSLSFTHFVFVFRVSALMNHIISIAACRLRLEERENRVEGVTFCCTESTMYFEHKPNLRAGEGLPKRPEAHCTQGALQVGFENTGHRNVCAR